MSTGLEQKTLKSNISTLQKHKAIPKILEQAIVPLKYRDRQYHLFLLPRLAIFYHFKP